jgi:hypothetical protein
MKSFMNIMPLKPLELLCENDTLCMVMICCVCVCLCNSEKYASFINVTFCRIQDVSIERNLNLSFGLTLINNEAL